MLRRTLLASLAAIILVPVIAVPAMAQSTDQPDAWVKGSGAIPAHQTNIGAFDINVARFGSSFTGGIRYTEYSADSSQALTKIYSQTITELTVIGNTATIKARGYWNAMAAEITVYVLDDLNNDNFRIIAKPLSLLQIIYDQQGGLIYGDIQIYSQPRPPTVKGEGTIVVGKNAGRFAFKAEKTNAGASGTVDYVEYNPSISSATVRPNVRIYVPTVERLIVNGNTAVLAGRGTYNGKPAWIEVTAVDNAGYSLPRPDQFTIRATPLTTDSVSRSYYYASGPLTSGDIVIHQQNGIF